MKTRQATAVAQPSSTTIDTKSPTQGTKYRSELTMALEEIIHVDMLAESKPANPPVYSVVDPAAVPLPEQTDDELMDTGEQNQNSDTSTSNTNEVISSGPKNSDEKNSAKDLPDPATTNTVEDRTMLDSEYAKLEQQFEMTAGAKWNSSLSTPQYHQGTRMIIHAPKRCKSCKERVVHLYGCYKFPGMNEAINHRREVEDSVIHTAKLEQQKIDAAKNAELFAAAELKYTELQNMNSKLLEKVNKLKIELKNSNEELELTKRKIVDQSVENNQLKKKLAGNKPAKKKNKAKTTASDSNIGEQTTPIKENSSMDVEQTNDVPIVIGDLDVRMSTENNQTVDEFDLLYAEGQTAVTLNSVGWPSKPSESKPDDSSPSKSEKTIPEPSSEMSPNKEDETYLDPYGNRWKESEVPISCWENVNFTVLEARKMQHNARSKKNNSSTPFIPVGKRKRASDSGEAAKSLGPKNNRSQNKSASKRPRTNGNSREHIPDYSAIMPKYFKANGQPSYGRPPTQPSENDSDAAWAAYFSHPSVNTPDGALIDERGQVSPAWVKIYRFIKRIGPPAQAENVSDIERNAYKKRANRFKRIVTLYASIPGYLTEKWVELGYNSLVPVGPKIQPITDLDEASILKQLRLAINSPQLLSEIYSWARTRRNHMEQMNQEYSGDYSTAPNQASLDELRQRNARNTASNIVPQCNLPTLTTPATVAPSPGQMQPLSASAYPVYPQNQPSIPSTGPTPIQPIHVFPTQYQSGNGAPPSVNPGGYSDFAAHSNGQAYSVPYQQPYNYGYAQQNIQYGSTSTHAHPQPGQVAFSIANHVANGHPPLHSTVQAATGNISSYAPPPPTKTPPPHPSMEV